MAVFSKCCEQERLDNEEHNSWQVSRRERAGREGRDTAGRTAERSTPAKSNFSRDAQLWKDQLW